MIKVVTVFLVFLMAVAVIGGLRFPWRPRRPGSGRPGPHRLGSGRCPACGRPRIGNGPCPCGGKA